MKVTRAYLGKYVEVAWRDPLSPGRRIKTRTAPKGWSALATWRERGVIDDITDGVLRIVHSAGEDPAWDLDPEPEMFCVFVPEALVESITTYEPTKTEKETM